MQYNKERILSRLMEMIQIDSVSYKEGPRTAAMKYTAIRLERPWAGTTAETS